MLMHISYVNYAKFEDKLELRKSGQFHSYNTSRDFLLDASHIRNPNSKFFRYVASDYSGREISDFALKISNKFDHKLQKHGSAQIDVYIDQKGTVPVSYIWIVLWSTPGHEVNVWFVPAGTNESTRVANATTGQGKRGAISLV
jgi:hypothetical protein